MGTSPIRVLVVLALSLVLAGCQRDSGEMSDPADETPPASELTISTTDGPGQAPTMWTLTCDPPGGSHPDPAGACQALETARRPFAPVPADMRCTQVYGGPETAAITGTWRGERVDASYKRTDGCETARWNALRAVLAPAGRR